MGLFDHVTCEYPLPDPRHQELEFQTKDLDSLLHYYRITRDGRLLRMASKGDVWGERVAQDVEWPIHGDIRIYAHDDEADRGVDYVVRFTHGRVESVRAPTEIPAPAIKAADGPPTVAEEIIEGRRLTAEEFFARTPEKLELVGGRIPGDEDLLVLLLTGLGVRRAIELIGPEPWRRALAAMANPHSSSP